jgi:hypothetical protein
MAAELVFATNNQVVGGTVTVDPKQVMRSRDLFLNLAKRAHPYNRP